MSTVAGKPFCRGTMRRRSLGTLVNNYCQSSYQAIGDHDFDGNLLRKMICSTEQVELRLVTKRSGKIFFACNGITYYQTWHAGAFWESKALASGYHVPGNQLQNAHCYSTQPPSPTQPPASIPQG